MTIRVTITHDVGTVGDLRAFLAEIDRAGLDETTPLHGKTKLDVRSRHGARLTQITVGATPTDKDPAPPSEAIALAWAVNRGNRRLGRR